MSSPSRISQLSEIISKHTATINNFFVEKNLPTPSFEADALWSLPIPEDATNIKAARFAIISACAELQALITGPKDYLTVNYTAHSSIRIILRFNLDKSFPVGESTTFEAMSQFSGLNVMNIKRIVRHAILIHRFFQEKTPGIITHSAPSAVIAGDELARNALVVQLEEFVPAGYKVADALEKWPNSEECNETGFSLINNTDRSMYQVFADEPARGARFGMLFNRVGDPPNLFFDNYDWKDVKKFVDVGGSYGSIAIGLAERFPHVKCIVQDLPDTILDAISRLPASLKDRVDFVAHNFFMPQNITADVYFFRDIFHNWADKYAIRILQNLIPALRKGARIVINDRILPAFDDLNTLDAERSINMDIAMLQLLNSQQRNDDEWLQLFRRADSRYHYLGPRKPEGASRWIIEAEWEG